MQSNSRILLLRLPGPASPLACPPVQKHPPSCRSEPLLLQGLRITVSGKCYFWHSEKIELTFYALLRHSEVQGSPCFVPQNGHSEVCIRHRQSHTTSAGVRNPYGRENSIAPVTFRWSRCIPPLRVWNPQILTSTVLESMEITSSLVLTVSRCFHLCKRNSLY